MASDEYNENGLSQDTKIIKERLSYILFNYSFKIKTSRSQLLILRGIPSESSPPAQRGAVDDQINKQV